MKYLLIIATLLFITSCNNIDNKSNLENKNNIDPVVNIKKDNNDIKKELPIPVSSTGEIIEDSNGCNNDYKPVCGSNNITYPNECIAKNIPGITIISEGECKE